MISVDPTKGPGTMTTRNMMRAAGLGLSMVLAMAWATPASADEIYVSLSAGGTAGTGMDAVDFKDEDILVFDNEETVAADAWNMFFDGSDVGLPKSADIDAFHILDDGDILMSFKSPITIPGLAFNAGCITAADIVEFVPTSTGPNTAGDFFIFFDGSDVGVGPDLTDPEDEDDGAGNDENTCGAG